MAGFELIIEVEDVNEILGLLDFRENALIYGEPLDLRGDWPSFGGFERADRSLESVRLCQAGLAAVKRAGLPRAVNTDGQWRIG